MGDFYAGLRVLLEDLRAVLLASVSGWKLKGKGQALSLRAVGVDGGAAVQGCRHGQGYKAEGVEGWGHVHIGCGNVDSLWSGCGGGDLGVGLWCRQRDMCFSGRSQCQGHGPICQCAS